MPTAQADRISFSSYEVQAPTQIAGVMAAQASVAAQQVKAQAIDTANMNLFIPGNTLINQYQVEFNSVDGNTRTTIAEQDIVNAANKKLQNDFFPNDTTQAVPSLSALHNVWPYLNPFALSFAIGKNYLETYTTLTPNEDAEITAIQGYFTTLSGNTDIQNTTGQKADTVLSNPIITYTALQTLSTNLNAAVAAWKTALQAQAAAIALIVDSNPTNTAQNTAALTNINSVIIPAINAFLALPTFTPMPGSTTGTVFNSTNPATLTPHPQLYSVNLATFTAAVTARATFVATRTAQLNTILGTIAQDMTTGNVTSSSGLYGQRYGFLALRLNALNGSLTVLSSFMTATSAQTNIIANIKSTAATYYSIIPTTAFNANANGTPFVSLADVSFLNVGDSVYVMADNQVEIPMAIKTIVGNAVTLNDNVPAKYTIASNVRLYKDLG
jgi:hypothetical protein